MLIFLQYKFLKKEGDPNVRIEGKDAEDWMCIDFGMWKLEIRLLMSSLDSCLCKMVFTFLLSSLCQGIWLFTSCCQRPEKHTNWRNSGLSAPMMSSWGACRLRRYQKTSYMMLKSQSDNKRQIIWLLQTWIFLCNFGCIDSYPCE